ncbi:pyridoxal phosphate-dependent transferase [Lipomyces tetrasporus]|uniref:aromatic-amino-acid transaminase n=1 Tax=Lipomyces tetrasporus TaxID=54092 RepID=A0AAD7VVM2_9ASCO|nr:pyridoxal phosphate-dependent transferase [Lipomyces tetrasporus]KAJ8103151.1 pyridoxal phosphate-dependent transferase [Lipomyces tetrasporus]
MVPPPHKAETELLDHSDSLPGAIKPVVPQSHTESKPIALDLSHHLSIESKIRQKSLLKVSSSYLARDPELLSLAAGLPSPSLFPIEKITASVPIAKHESARNGLWKDDGLLPGTRRDLHKEKDSSLKGHSEYDLSGALQYEQGTGSKQLLKFLKRHTEIVHNPPYRDWDCIMTGGNTHAMETVFRMLINPGDYIVLEEFAFPETVEGLKPLRARMVGIDMDAEGMRSDSLEQLLETWDEAARGGKRPGVLYTVPTGQNPTGATMSVQRRSEIYNICVKYDLVIIEDDPYYFLQMSDYIPGADPGVVQVPKTNDEFLTTLLPSMLSMDTQGRVLRLDSFSKVAAPGLRCGWITGSDGFVERVLRHNEVGLQFPSGVSMAVLHSMLTEAWGQDGYLDWLVNLRAEYTSRRNAIVSAMDKFLPREVCDWVIPSAGMFVWIRVDYTKHPHKDNGIEAVERELFEAGIENKVLILPGTWFKVNPEARDVFFRATFASVSAKDMAVAIKRFGEVLRKGFALQI